MSSEHGLAVGRSRRGNAGDKLAELMAAGLQPDDMFPEEANDNEFEAAGDVADVFDSDFDETDDEAGGDEEEAGERELERQQAEARRAERAKGTGTSQRNNALPKALAHVRLPKQSTGQLPASIISVNSRPPTQDSRQTRREQREKRAQAIFDPTDGIRTSSRTSTVASKAQLQERIEQDHQRRTKAQAQAARTQSQAVKHEPLTQDRLIAEALMVEESNRASLRRLLEREEALRRRARVAQNHELQGPYLRWRSVAVPDQPLVQAGDLTQDKPAEAAERTSQPIERRSTSAQGQETAPSSDAAGTSIEPLHTTAPPAGSSVPNNTNQPPASTDLPAPADPAPPQTQIPTANPADLQVPHALPPTTTPQPTPESNTLDSALIDPAHQARLEAQRLRYPVHQTQAIEGPKHGQAFVSLHSLPMAWEDDWVREWNSVFGSHTDWAAPTIVPVRNRPHRPAQSICPISGLGALYRDARTYVPLANLSSAQTLDAITREEYIWTGEEGNDSALDYGAFMARTDDRGAAGVFGAYWKQVRSRAVPKEEVKEEPQVPESELPEDPSMPPDEEDLDNSALTPPPPEVQESSGRKRKRSSASGLASKPRGKKKAAQASASELPTEPKPTPAPPRGKPGPKPERHPSSTAPPKRRKSAPTPTAPEPGPSSPPSAAPALEANTPAPDASAPALASDPPAAVDPAKDSTPVAVGRPARKHVNHYEYALAPVVAPGDERSLLAGARALPGRSTRSGRARPEAASQASRPRKRKSAPSSAIPESTPAMQGAATGPTDVVGDWTGEAMQVDSSVVPAKIPAPPSDPLTPPPPATS